MGKITVKHYLNKSQSKKAGGEDTKQQVYVQITVKRQVNRLKSKANKFVGLSDEEFQLTSKEFESEMANRESLIAKAIAIECRLISDIITFLNPFNRENFTLTSFSTIYELSTMSVYGAIELSGKMILHKSMKDDWREVWNILDKQSSLIATIDGLSLLGSSNRSFRSQILLDEYIILSKVALEYLNEFLELQSNKKVETANLDSLYYCWYKNNLTAEYVEYLAKKKYISINQLPVMHEIIYLLTNDPLSLIKIHSDKE